jgi:AraC-like DNA-binding protein
MDGGIQQVRDSLLDASYIYPTHGDQILDLAVRILEGKPYEKETMLMSALVTSDNAKVLQMESEEIMRQAAYLDQLHEKADNYLQQLGTQRIVNWLAIGIIALLLAAIVLFYLYHVGKMTLRKERVVNTLWNIKPEDIPVIEGTTEPSKPSGETAAVEHAEESEPIANTFFITRFKEAVESRLEDSELSVEDLASDMNLSRVQLYRKVKAVTGSTPIELLRTARLNRAYQMLMTTDRSVSEIAYQVGFSAPSYFTKCFKEEYGMLPGDVRK